ncbi:MAG: 50S ribosomal protein L40e [Candidatus Aenigmatarchaeota archaeon]
MPEEAVRKRLFDNVFICMNCKAKMRAKPRKVRDGKVKCRKCGSKDLRLKSKEDRS